MAYWLFKSEPDTFGIDDLKARGKQGEPWDGVRNYQARNMLRDEVKKGDQIFFYHSNTKVPGIVGIAEVIKEAFPDPTQFDPESKYYDPKASADNPRWFCPQVRFKQKFRETISLEQLKTLPALADMPLVRKGNRLSVMPVTPQQWKFIMGYAN
ncbi:MAG: EVE domain-containing protein [Pseudomonadota bacterium]|nr:EVE domain-containing protein [Pseudomonadales bacterium]MDY6921479.1 EVE domain-containing protein [Pseudomonadota bacterium]|tara:strand:- start:15 stop:476 length:462 start_codon:yes stop_codon:yes gene_type:complete